VLKSEIKLLNKLRDFTLLWAVSTICLYGAIAFVNNDPVLSYSNIHFAVMAALCVSLFGQSVINTIRSSIGRWIFLVVYLGCTSFLFWLFNAATAVI